MSFLHEPLPDTNLVIVEARCDEGFRGVTIGIGGSGGNLALATEAFTKVCIGSADMPLEGVSAASFVEREVSSTGGVRIVRGRVALRQ